MSLPTRFEFVGPERKGLSDRWRTVSVAGVQYQVGVVRGSHPIRIAFKPRGKNIGWHWFGVVRDAKGREVYSTQVNKSAGVRGLLIGAGLIAPWTSEPVGDGGNS